MKKLKVILLFGLLSIILSPTIASASCSWRAELTTSNPELGTSNTSGGCVTGESLRNTTSKEQCSGNQPAGDSSMFASTRYLCCCADAASNTVTEKEPKFDIPIPEVNIPTVKLTKVDCVADDTGKYNCAIPWIGEYINGIYQYGINIVGILAAIMLMAGGLLWLISGGDASKITQAKDIIIGSITGMVILMASYIILTQVNPDLVKMGSISTGYIVKDTTPLPENTGEFAAKCKSTTTGNCAVSKMSGFGSRATQASAICMAESGGNAGIFNSLTKCAGGEYAVWGLFQFNLSANRFIDENNNTLDCPKAYNKTWTNSSPSCAIVNKTLYDACVKAATNPDLSILNAQKLVNAAGGWGPWEANSKWCNF
jgi:hypothetical protein